MAIMADHRIPCAATLSVAHRDDFMGKVRKARRQETELVNLRIAAAREKQKAKAAKQKKKETAAAEIKRLRSQLAKAKVTKRAKRITPKTPKLRR